MATTAGVAGISALLALAVAAPAGAARYDGWSSESGIDPVATIADLDVDRDAIVPGDAGAPLELTYRSVVAQHVRIVALDARGRTVRTIVDAQVAAGEQRHEWDGRGDDGVNLADGEYEIVVEAGTARDSLSVSDVVRVDTRAPSVRSPVARVRLARGGTSFRLPIVASEAALLEVRTTGASGSSRTAGARGFGRSSLVVPVASRALLARALARGRARARVTIVATDPAGNRSIRSIGIELLPPAAASGDGGNGPGSVDPGPVSGTSKLSWPLTGAITSRFGPRWGRMHNGIDVGVPSGRPIGAAGPGRVTYAGWMSGYGNTVIVDHGSLETLYAHQSSIRVRVGQSVMRGQVVGLVGSTGNSTGPHLHFEVRVGGAAKDPLRYLP